MSYKVIFYATNYRHSSVLQGRYFDEPEGKPGKESKQAQDESIAHNFWELCANLAGEVLGERVD